MEFAIHPFLLYAASWVTITGGTWALFDRAETVASDETKIAVSRWLRNLDPAGSIANWPSTFLAVFDNIFGKKHLTWNCFFRSCVASLVSVFIIILIFSAIRPEFVGLVKRSSFHLFIIFLFGTTAFLNFIPDYLSLLETRYVIKLLANRLTVRRIFLFAAVDLIATAIIASLILLAVVMIFKPTMSYSDDRFHATGTIGYKELIIDSFSFSMRYGPFYRFSIHRTPDGRMIYSPPSPMPFAIWYYSAFFTSAWVWLYALSGLAVKLAQYSGIWIGRISSLMDIENKPLRSLGMISNLLITLLYLILLFIR
ncbi:MAG: hypothetical protein ACFFCW_18955 [Candidatus Hodarchaeota archaeon]